MYVVANKPNPNAEDPEPIEKPVDERFDMFAAIFIFVKPKKKFQKNNVEK